MKNDQKDTNATTQFAKFGVIGASNAIVDIGSLNLILWLVPTDNNGLLVLFNTISYSLAILNSYIWNSKWTFRSRAAYSNREKITFIIQAMISLLISNVVFIAGIKVAELTSFSTFMEKNVAKGLAMLLSSLASFFFMKWFVFKKEKEK